MNEYHVILDCGISGYKFDLLIDAETPDVAQEKAIEEVRDMLGYMLNHIHVSKISEE